MGLAEKTPWKTLLIPAGLYFIGDSCFVLNMTYADSLFLASYPASWLSYYFIASPLLVMLVFGLLSPFLAKACGKKVAYCVFSLVLGLACIQASKGCSFYLQPFILALCLCACSMLFLTAMQNATAAAFDVQFFKKYAFYFSLAASLGALLSAGAIPILVYFFKNQAVLYLSMLELTLGAVGIYRLQPLKVPKASAEKNLAVSPYKQSLFRSIFLYIGLALCLSALARFAFQRNLVGHYSEEQMATFISLINGLVSGSSLLLQALIGRCLMRSIGFANIILLAPIAAFFTGAALFVWPIFLSFILFYIVQNVAEEGLISPCREILLNPFPTLLRNKSALFLRGQAMPLGSLCGAGLIVIINQYLGLDYIGPFVLFAAGLWIYFGRKLRRDYSHALLSAIRENRFLPNLAGLSPSSIQLLSPEVLSALESQEADRIQRAGLVFFEQANYHSQLNRPEIIQALVKLLDFDAAEIRLKAVQALQSLEATSSIQALETRLRHEEQLSVGLAILDTLLQLNPAIQDQQAQKLMQEKQLLLQAYGLALACRSCNTAILAMLEQQLEIWRQSSPAEQWALAKISRYFPNRHCCLLIQSAFLESQDLGLAIAGIEAIHADSDPQLIAKLLPLLAEKNKSFYASEALLRCRSQSLSALANWPLAAIGPEASALIRTLVGFCEASVFVKLSRCSQKPNFALRQQIAQSITEARPVLKLDRDHKRSIIEHLVALAEEIIRLQQFKMPEREELCIELDLQLRINRLAFVHWFALVYDSPSLGFVSNYFLNPERYNQTDKSKAYELLDSLADTASLREAIHRLSQAAVPSTELRISNAPNPSLLSLVQYQTPMNPEAEMNLVDSLIFLRSVRLFANIPLEALEPIAKIAQPIAVSAGEVLFEQGDTADYLYCIVSGQIQISHNGKSMLALQAKDYFGELSILDQKPRNATAKVLQDGVLLRIHQCEFQHILEDLPMVASPIISQIVGYLRQNLAAKQDHD